VIPFADLGAQYAALKDEIDAAIARVLEHCQFIMGPEVEALEEALAGFAGANHCISVASGTDALLISLMALGIGPGDEVIIPAFTFGATAEVVLLVGATPVLVDIEGSTCNIDIAAIEPAISARTRAIMPVSLYGQPPDMDEINAIADRYGLAVIEDGAQSFGATYKGRHSCALSPIGCTSFFPSKPLGCYGDGGAIFCNHDDVARVCREIRVHGQSGRYHHTRIGLAGRMDTLQCAIVLAKLPHLRAELGRRAEIGSRYDELLDHEAIGKVAQRLDRTSALAQYTVFVEDRDRIQSVLKDDGIPTAVHYPAPISAQPAFGPKSRYGDLSNSEQAARTVLSLPMSAYLTEADQDLIAGALLKAVQSG
jgi:UDP-2-acetamido-2-deoxy-ribo-hexuluronate aminotransferase